MKLLEDPKQRFPLKEFSPYGFCVVVPGAEFDPDWEAELVDHGYKCFDLDADGEPVTLVRVVKTEKGSGEKTVSSPPIASTASTESETFPRRWPEKEEKRLLERWNKVKGTAAERSAALAPDFPGRTAQAIMLKAKKMRRERGLSRKYSKRSKKALKDTSVHTPVDTSVHNAPEKTPSSVSELMGKVHGKLPRVQDDTVHQGESSVLSISTDVLAVLKEIKDLLEPASFSFESYCPCCHERRTESDEEKVWRVCPKCGCELIVWNVEVSA